MTPTQEFLDRLDLHDVTLVGTDTGGALVQLLIGEIRAVHAADAAATGETAPDRVRVADDARGPCDRALDQARAQTAETRRDTVRVLRAIAAERDLMVEAAEQLPSFERPALEDRVMPPEHGRRL
jgi:pimeloyl-ACP methyl ester carboxylesterase